MQLKNLKISTLLGATMALLMGLMAAVVAVALGAVAGGWQAVNAAVMQAARARVRSECIRMTSGGKAPTLDPIEGRCK